MDGQRRRQRKMQLEMVRRKEEREKKACRSGSENGIYGEIRSITKQAQDS